MTDDFSQLDEDAPFSDTRETSFEQLITSFDFWKAATTSTHISLLFTGQDLDTLCRQFTEDSSIIFELAFKQGVSLDEILKRHRHRGWTAQYVWQTHLAITLAREIWNLGGMTKYYETYSPSLRAILAKAEAGTPLTPQERALLVVNGIHRRAMSNLSLHPAQWRVMREELEGLPWKERQEKIRQFMLEVQS